MSKVPIEAAMWILLTNEEAEELDAYKTLIDLNNLEYDDMLNEYYAVK